MVAALRAAKRFAFEHGGLLALATLAVYMFVAPVHIVDGDNAEFATLAKLGGTAHPSGYPLYLLWLRAFAWLPGTSPAHTAALATVILGVLGVLVLHAACRAWGARPLAATLAVAIYAAGPEVMRIQTEAEVFALNNLVVATVLWLAATAGPVKGAWRAGLLGLCAGLGIANHLSCVLIAPIGLLGIVRSVREAKPLVLGYAILGLVVGLLPYVYVFVTVDTAISWGRIRDLDGLIGLVSRRDYGGLGAFAPNGTATPAATSLAAMASTIGRAWLWAPLVLGVISVIDRMVRRMASGESRIGWSLLVVSWLVAGPLVAVRFNVAPEGLGLYIVQRFHIMPVLLLAPPIAVGFDWLLARVERLRRLTMLGPAIVATLGFAALAAPSLPYVQRVRTAALEHAVRNTLRQLPPDAVLLEDTDELYAGAAYLQWVLGERQDVVVIKRGMLGRPWYRDRIARRGFVASPSDRRPVIELARRVLASGRRLFCDRSQEDVIASFPSYPYGTLFEVLSPEHAPPTLDEVFALNKEIYGRYDLDYPKPGSEDEFATVVQRRYVATWLTLAQALDAAGKRDDATWAAEAARELAPTP